MTTEEAARVLKKMYDDGMRTEKGWASLWMLSLSAVVHPWEKPKTL